jgi:hypothetical protein
MSFRNLKPLVLGVSLALVCTGPAFAVSSEILRLKFSETVSGGQYAQGQVAFDGIAPSQDGTVDLLGTAPGFLTQVSSPISGFGSAMKFGTTSCTATACTQLGHVRIPDSAGVFAPLSGNFEWGATVQLTALPTGQGMNVVQKGRSGSPDMWKLQLDGGVASCIIKVDGATAANFGKAASPQLTVGRNYKLRCKRVSGVLTLTVTEFAADGTQLSQNVYPKTQGVSLGNLNDFGTANSVYVGGKGTASSPDQLRDAVLDTVTYWAG